MLVTADVFAQTVSHSVVLNKDSLRQLTRDKIPPQIETIISSVQTARRTSLGWKIEPNPHVNRNGYQSLYRQEHRGGNDYRYHVELSVTCRLDRPRPSIDSEFENIVAAIAASGQTPKWTVAAVDDEPYESKRAAAAPDGINGSADVGYVPLVMPDNWDSHFAHLYGLGPHVRRVHNALDLALRSGWTRRENCALIGPPGCAKTDICQSIERAVGADSVLEFDATATTAAGALKELNRRAELPRVLLVEEIEKTPSQEALTWLLGILDMRAAILKTTAHDRIERDVHMFAVCTVNDVERFRAINSGALASRFPNKIHFRRPPREMLGHILRREIDRIGGSDEWIEPALDYAAKIGTADPREVISIALCGGDRLLDGTYQADMDATSAAAVAEDQEANP